MSVTEADVELNFLIDIVDDSITDNQWFKQIKIGLKDIASQQLDPQIKLKLIQQQNKHILDSINELITSELNNLLNPENKEYQNLRDDNQINFMLELWQQELPITNLYIARELLSQIKIIAQVKENQVNRELISSIYSRQDVSLSIQTQAKVRNTELFQKFKANYKKIELLEQIDKLESKINSSIIEGLKHKVFTTPGNMLEDLNNLISKIAIIDKLNTDELSNHLLKLAIYNSQNLEQITQRLTGIQLINQLATKLPNIQKSTLEKLKAQVLTYEMDQANILISKISKIAEFKDRFPKISDLAFETLTDVINNSSSINLKEIEVQLEQLNQVMVEIDVLLTSDNISGVDKKGLEKIRQTIQLSDKDKIPEAIITKVERLETNKAEINRLKKNKEDRQSYNDRINEIHKNTAFLKSDEIASHLSAIKEKVIKAFEQFEFSEISSEINSIEQRLQQNKPYLDLLKNFKAPEQVKDSANMLIDLLLNKKVIVGYERGDIVKRTPVEGRKGLFKIKYKKIPVLGPIPLEPQLNAKINLVKQALQQKQENLPSESYESIALYQLLEAIKKIEQSDYASDELSESTLRKLEEIIHVSSLMPKKLSELKPSIEQIEQLPTKKQQQLKQQIIDHLVSKSNENISETISNTILALKKEEFFDKFKNELTFLKGTSTLTSYHQIPFKDEEPDNNSTIDKLDSLIKANTQIAEKVAELNKLAEENKINLVTDPCYPYLKKAKNNILQKIASLATPTEINSYIEQEIKNLEGAIKYHQLHPKVDKSISELRAKVMGFNHETLNFQYWMFADNPEKMVEDLRSSIPEYEGEESIKELKTLESKVATSISLLEEPEKANTEQIIKTILDRAKDIPDRYPTSQAVRQNLYPIKHFIILLLYDRPIPEHLANNFIELNILPADFRTLPPSEILKLLKSNIENLADFEIDKAKTLDEYGELKQKVDNFREELFGESISKDAYESDDYRLFSYSVRDLKFAGNPKIDEKYTGCLNAIDSRLNAASVELLARFKKLSSEYQKIKDSDSALSLRIYRLKEDFYENLFDEKGDNLQEINQNLTRIEQRVAFEIKQQDLLGRQEAIIDHIKTINTKLKRNDKNLLLSKLSKVESAFEFKELERIESQLEQHTHLLRSAPINRLIDNIEKFQDYLADHPELAEEKRLLQLLTENFLDFLHEPEGIYRKREDFSTEGLDSNQQIIKEIQKRLYLIEERAYGDAFDSLSDSRTELSEYINNNVEMNLFDKIKDSSKALKELGQNLNKSPNIEEVLKAIGNCDYFKNDDVVKGFIENCTPLENSKYSPQEIATKIKLILSPEHIAVKHKIDKLHHALYKRKNDTKADEISDALNQLSLEERADLMTCEHPTDAQVAVHKALASKRSLYSGIVRATDNGSQEGKFIENKATESFTKMKEKLQDLKQQKKEAQASSMKEQMQEVRGSTTSDVPVVKSSTTK